MLKLGGFKPAHFSHFYSKHGWDHQNNCKGCIYILGGGLQVFNHCYLSGTLKLKIVFISSM